MPSSIPYVDESWNLVTGCEAISPACDNCWAARLASTRLRHLPRYAGLTTADGRWTGKVRMDNWSLDAPKRVRRPTTWFVAPHGDLFHSSVFTAFIRDAFDVMAACPRHTFIVLTKRARRMFETLRGISPLPNVWLGATVENQPAANDRLPWLIDLGWPNLWASIEPCLGLIDLTNIRLPPWEAYGRVDALRGAWFVDGRDDPQGGNGRLKLVMVGGESGSRARPMHPDWERSLRDQCEATGVLFHKKQQGEWTVFYDRDRDDPDWRRCPKVDGQMGRGAERYLNLAGGCGLHGERVVAVRNVGIKNTSPTLDGRAYLALPWPVGAR